jgi:integrase
MKWELKRERYMTRDEVRALRRACEDRASADLAKGRVSGVRAWAILDFASQTGLRVSEVANVRTEDLHLKGHHPCVWVVGGKSRMSVRAGRPEREPVSLSSGLVKHLRDFITFKEQIGEDTAPRDCLFVSKRGSAFSTRALQKMFKEACRRANLPDYYSFHSLRHSFGIYLYQKTKNLRLVQKELRHRSPQTTAVYADVTPEERSEAVDGLWDE